MTSKNEGWVNPSKNEKEVVVDDVKIDNILTSTTDQSISEQPISQPVVEMPKKNTTTVMKAKSKYMDFFKPAIEIPAVECLKVGVYSTAKCGKTHFCLTSKLPIYYLDTERSANILVKQLPEEIQKQIFILDLVQFSEKTGDHMDMVKSMEAAFDAISELVDTVEQSNEIGTIVIDSMSDLWEFLKIWLGENVDEAKKFNNGETIMGTEWGKANKRWSQLFRLLMASNWNIVLTFKAKEEFNNKGVYNADWQKNTFHWLDLNMEIKRIGDQHKFIIKGGRFGDKYDDLVNPTFDSVREYLTKISGVKFL